MLVTDVMATLNSHRTVATPPMLDEIDRNRRPTAISLVVKASNRQKGADGGKTQGQQVKAQSKGASKCAM